MSQRKPHEAECELDETYLKHDSAFKYGLSYIDIARRLLQAHLMPAHVNRICWGSLTHYKASFVDEMLHQHHADAIFSAQCVDGTNCVIIVEAKAQHDTGVSIQTTDYALQFYNAYKRDRPDDIVPWIIPIVFYHGPGGLLPKDFFSQFGGNASFAAETLLMPQFVNLNDCPDALFERHGSCGLIEYSLKHVQGKQEIHLDPLFGSLVDQFVKEKGTQAFLVVLQYLLAAANSEDEAAFLREVARYIPYQIRSKAMTLGDRLIARGEARGEARGFKKGRVEERTRMAKSLVDAGVDRGIIEQTLKKLEEES